MHHLRSLPLITDHDQSDRDTVALARRHSLSGYDAAYLETAKRRGADLATLDLNLANASAREGL
jgi:predicted nucleic acid-binding protein